METLNEPSQWTNAAQVDSFVTLCTRMDEWSCAHLCRNSYCSITWKVCFRFQTLRTHFQLLNLTTLFSSSIFCFLSLRSSSSTHFHHLFSTDSPLPPSPLLSHPSLPPSHYYHPTLCLLIFYKHLFISLSAPLHTIFNATWPVVSYRITVTQLITEQRA